MSARQSLFAIGPCSGAWPAPAKCVELLPGDGAGVKQLEATQDAVWAVAADGSLYRVTCHTPMGSPTCVRLRPPPGLLAFEQIACGTQHCLFSARTAAGGLQVWALGNNVDGQCGLPTSLADVRAPTMVPSVTRQLAVKRLSAGSAFSAAVLSSGGVAVWGGVGSRAGAAPAIVTIPAAAFAGGTRHLHYATGSVADRGASGEVGHHGHGGDDPLLPPGCAVDVGVGSAHFVVGTATTGVFEFAAPPLEQRDAATSCFSASSGLRGHAGAADAVGRGGSGGAVTPDSHLRVWQVTEGPLWGVRPLRVYASGDTSFMHGADGHLYSWGLVHSEWVAATRHSEGALTWAAADPHDRLVSSLSHLKAQGALSPEEVPDAALDVMRRLRPASARTEPDVTFAPQPHMIATHERWAAVAVSKTGTRSGPGGDIQPAPADEGFESQRDPIVLSDAAGGELERTPLRDALTAGFQLGSRTTSWALSSVLGITQRGHRLVPADGRPRLHRVVPPRGLFAAERRAQMMEGAPHAEDDEAAGQGDAEGIPAEWPGPPGRETDASAARPLLHELLARFAVGQVAQCRGLVVFTGAPDPAVTTAMVSGCAPAAAVSRNDGATSGTRHMGPERWGVTYGYGHPSEAGVLWPAPEALQPAWLVAPRSALLADAEARASSSAMSQAALQSCSHLFAPSASDAAVPLYVAAAVRPLDPIRYDQAALASLLSDGSAAARSTVDDVAWLDAPLEPTTSGALESTSGEQPSRGEVDVTSAEATARARRVLLVACLLSAANNELKSRHAKADATAATARDAMAAELEKLSALAAAEQERVQAPPAQPPTPPRQTVAASPAVDCDDASLSSFDGEPVDNPMSPALLSLMNSVGSPGQRLKIKRRPAMLSAGTPQRSSAKAGTSDDTTPLTCDSSPAVLAPTPAYLRQCDRPVVVQLAAALHTGDDTDSAAPGVLASGHLLAASDVGEASVAAHTSLPVPLSWWEADDSYSALCRYAYGHGWRSALQAALTSFTESRLELRLERYDASGEVTQQKRGRARQLALEDAYALALQLARARRQRMEGALASLAGDFTLTPALCSDSGGASLELDPWGVCPRRYLLPRYPVHQALLSARVPHFYAPLVASRMREATEGAARLPSELGSSVPAVVAFLRFVYEGAFEPGGGARTPPADGTGTSTASGSDEVSTVSSLLAAADLCLLGDLKAACERYLITHCATPHASSESMQRLLAFAQHHNARRLRNFVLVAGQTSGALPYPAPPRKPVAFGVALAPSSGRASPVTLTPPVTARSGASTDGRPPRSWAQVSRGGAAGVGLAPSGSSVSLAAALREAQGGSAGDDSAPASARSDLSDGDDMYSAFTDVTGLDRSSASS